MKYKTERSPLLWGCILLLFACFATLPTQGAFGQAQRTYVGGQIVLYCQPGTAQADVNALAAEVSATVTPLLLADCYKLTLPAGTPNILTATTTAVATLKQDPRVRHVSPNWLHSIFQTVTTLNPNDPYYVQKAQWGLAMINMPQAWAIQQGVSGVNLCWIDTGYDPKHVDFQNRIMADSYDYADNTSDVTANGTGEGYDHGTMTSGVAMANTNNGVGIAGIDWLNTQVLAYKVVAKGADVSNGLDEAAIINSLAACLAHAQKDGIVAVNESYGGLGDPTDTSDPEYIGNLALVNAGVTVVAAAGNSAMDNHQFVPCAYPFVVSVSSLGPSGNLASYSNFGKVEVAAPGGDQDISGNLSDGIITLTQNSTYSYVQGTSLAAPHVAAVMALLRAYPGVTAAQAVQALEKGANTSGLSSLPDTRYGYGKLDAYQSLLQVAVTAQILAPDGLTANGNQSNPSGTNPLIETLNPQIQLQFSNVNPASVQIKIDGKIVLADLTQTANQQYVTSGTAASSGLFTIGFYPTQVIGVPGLQPGSHTIYVSASDAAGDRSVNDTRIITVTPFTVPQGRSMISFPFTEALEPGGQRSASALLGSGFTLYRWEPTKLTYAVNGPSNNNLVDAAQASLTPPGVQVSPVGDTTPTVSKDPLGIGYFLDEGYPDLQVLTYGRNFPNQAFSIPLQNGWNMIGDPWDFSVPFQTALLQLANGTQIDISDAANQNLIAPNLYYYVNGGYQFVTLPNATLDPWQGYWVYVTGVSALPTLILSPTATTSSTGTRAVTHTTLAVTLPAGAATRAATPNPNAPNVQRRQLKPAQSTYQPVVSGVGSWALRLTAKTGSLTDSFNFIGQSGTASDGPDKTKLPKAPQVGGYVALSMTRAEAPNQFAQDLRALGGQKTWNVNVATDQPNGNVTVSWQTITAVPRACQLTLTDAQTGQTVDMRTQSSYVYSPGKAGGTRAFIVTARPNALAGHPVFSNVVVSPHYPAGRGAPSFEIGYTVNTNVTVDVSIISSAGRLVAHVGATRAVAMGSNSTVWNGRDQAGRPISSGVYSLQLQATTSEGLVTRQVLPFVNAGR
jgi:hypothetical protein